MPCDYRIDRTRRVVLARGYGPVTETDLTGNRERLSADPDFDPALNLLYDLTEATGVGASPVFPQSFAARSIFADASKRAVVAGDDSVFGVARAFLAWGAESSANIRVFRNIDEARRWLALDQADYFGAYPERFPGG